MSEEPFCTKDYYCINSQTDTCKKCRNMTNNPNDDDLFEPDPLDDDENEYEGM